MTFTRKLLALSAISALSFAFTACGDDGNSSSKQDSTPAAECTADACDADGVTLKKCNNGKIEKINCGANGQICSNNACAAKTAEGTKCTDADTKCIDDMTLNQCNPSTGAMNPVNCAEGNMICDNNQCIAKEAADCTANDKKCTTSDAFSVCGSDGKWGDDQKCGDNQICEAGECKNKPEESDTKCTAKAKKCADFESFAVCGNDGAWGKAQKCGDNKICEGDGECKDKPAASSVIIGQPCSCEKDCKIEITGKELKAALSPTVIGLAPTLGLTLPEDTDVISAPNYFSSSIKGCEGLTAPAGMAVGCFYSDKITVPASVSGLLGSVEGLLSNPLVASMIGGFADSLKDIDLGGMLAAAQKLLNDGIQFQAKNGYCLLADIDIKLNVTDDTIKGFIVMDEVNKLVEKINTPNHDHSKAKTAKCPDGSVLLTYTVAKETEGKGGADVGFDMCLKSCTKATEATDCRVADGYSCVELPNGVPTEEKPEVDKVSVCFDQKNIEYFEGITKDFEKYFPKKDGE